MAKFDTVRALQRRGIPRDLAEKIAEIIAEIAEIAETAEAAQIAETTTRSAEITIKQFEISKII